jgi:hypothetical protein
VDTRGFLLDRESPVKPYVFVNCADSRAGATKSAQLPLTRIGG